jgi:hypothetical protein
MINTKWTDSRTGTVYTIADTSNGYVDLDNGSGLTVRVSTANFTEHFTEVINFHKTATRAVERALHAWYHTDMRKASWTNGEVWEHLPSTSVRAFTEAAQGWLRDKSELRTSTIERADYTAIFRSLYLTPIEQTEPTPAPAEQDQANPYFDQLKAEYEQTWNKVEDSRGYTNTSAWHAFIGATENADLSAEQVGFERFSEQWYSYALGGFESNMSEYPEHLDPWTRNLEEDRANGVEMGADGRLRDVKTGRYVKRSA